MSHPPARETSSKSAPPPPADEARGEEPSQARGIVWIVEDNALEAEVAARVLASKYAITVFADGATMLERLSGEAGPDALVLDWQLPGMSGIEVCRFLRETRDEVALPILMLTVHGHKEDVIDGLAAGANDHVTKPYDPTELLARVGTLVRTRALHERVKKAERALSVERDRLLESELRLRVLAHAGVALNASLDSHAASERIARLAVPTLADWCGVYLRDGSSALKLVADAHTGDSRVSLLRATTAPDPLLPDAALGVMKVLRSAKPDLVSDAASALQAAEGRDAPTIEALREAGVTSWMVVPLAVQSRTFGCLAFVSLGSGRRYDEGDLSLAEELGRRTAVAIDNARLFEMTQRERARVEEANHTKDEFLATVSHELRTPLNAILGWTVMLRDGGMSEEKRARAIETIERNARSQTQLIEDLLDISRIISGKLRLNVSPVQPVSIVESAIDTVRPAADAKGVRLQPVLDSQVGPIMGDPERLQQIIWNLLSNAVKFTPKGGRVQVRLRRSDSDVEIAVADTGRGIPPEFLPHVFERFRQADMSLNRSHGGLGLGLAITRHLVELHGGRIEAESPGESMGSTFIVRIPMAPLSSTSIEKGVDPPVGPRARGLPCPPEVEGLRVLLVEDEQDARELMTSVLESCQIKVTAVHTVADAMEHIRREPPDVLVSDIGMPGESGYELIKKVRRLPPDRGGGTPAVALTAYARMEDRTRALMMGFDMHVPKPIEPAELLIVLAHLANRFSKTRTGG